MNVLLNIFEGSLYVSGEQFFDFLVRLLVNIVSLFILIRFIYYPNNSRVKYIFTFFMMGMMIFMIATALGRIKLDFGLALGLFAIFAITRFRSPSIDLKELTYLFIVMGISVINGLVKFDIADWFGLIVANFIILSIAFFMELYKPKYYILKKSLVFNPSDFSILTNHQLLIEEVKKVTGIDVLNVEIDRINKSKNEVSVWIFYRKRYNLPPHSSEKHYPEEEQTGLKRWESDYSNNY